MPHELRGSRYLTAANDALARFITSDLPFLDFEQTAAFYAEVVPSLDQHGRALLGVNDRFFLLTGLCRRVDALHPWLFNRCREVEAAPDDHLDLWARYHYKSTIITFAGAIQEILTDPEITIAIFSHTRPIALAFLTQIMQEFERNDYLKQIYPDVLWENPRTEAPVWGMQRGIVVKRRGNPKEATVEAHGLVDGQPVSRHYKLRIYDDVVTDKSVTNEEMIRKTTEKWELSDNLASTKSARKWHAGTRYNFGDTYGIIIDEGRGIKPRIYPATDDGTLKGKPVFLTEKRWEEIKGLQRRTVSAQMLLDPVAGNEAMFQSAWFKPYYVRPTFMNIYIMVDPSKGTSKTSDRTAIAVVGVDVAGNKYLLDGVRHRMKLSERWTHLKRLYLKWRDATGTQVIIVGYERYGMQADVEVIQDWQERDGVVFELVELAWPREGGHSKKDRVERLEPDMKAGKFYLPGVIHHPEYGGKDGKALWSVWSKADSEKALAEGKPNHTVGAIVYRPLMGELKEHRAMTATNQSYRIVQPIKLRDEESDVYDLTRAFILEAVKFPFATHDDLVDAVSRVYDLSPRPAVQYEAASLEPVAYADS